ncbi:MAG: Preprotein translocase, SecG subunit [Candidatus Magasanikbacteria bacterium GW2011_GWC2_34_16]|uniref:Protein-export membrane protein SecG n=2 Tax=Candidatus Magasanikiibacteriota TaxID=1752731 RepID=A0A0G0KKV7_9BACT|nr:MAG: Preprotein translocase, SecG subunit [Candidatus Magasanikbacteria bacterium GW2011_GWC2_34_16]KKQ41221.1 MAG: Preprotein translocase, SecG subunit [Candidatus Magasanikbacteria bacterium GW2011_GWA2_37_8]
MQETVFNIIQLVLAIFLTILILLQQKGTGLSGVFGGSSNVYSTKRGVDKILHFATIITAIVFFGTALLRLAL